MPVDTPLKCRIQRGRNQDLERIFSIEHFDILEAEGQTAILKWSFGDKKLETTVKLKKFQLLVIQF